MRRIEKRVETVEHEVNILICDICHDEVPVGQFGIHSYSFQALSDSMGSRNWWRKPLEKIVGLKKNSTMDHQDQSDFDVHVKCAYDVIKKAVKSNAGKNT